MAYFLLLLTKIVPLYLNIFLGFLAGRIFQSNRDTIAQILFYMITPVIIFNGVINTHIHTNILILPLMTFGISSLLCVLFYNLSKSLWQDSTRNLAAFSAGNANTGYFGLPLALMLFDDQGEGIYIMAILGINLYENSVGYYMLAKGSHTASECLLKLVKLPNLYALLLGLLFNQLHFPQQAIMNEFAGYMKGAYIVLGMMIIGLGLSSMSHFKLDYKFIGTTFLAKFVAWPLIMTAIIFGDMHYFHFFNVTIYNALMLISIVPMAANTVVLASLFKNHPEKAATAVVLSTLFALIYVPVMTTYLIAPNLK